MASLTAGQPLHDSAERELHNAFRRGRLTSPTPLMQSTSTRRRNNPVLTDPQDRPWQVLDGSGPACTGCSTPGSPSSAGR